MERGVPISTIMTKNVIALNYDDDLETAEILFKKYNIRHIPVVKGETIVGMISYTDLLRISFADAVDEYDSDIDTVVYNMFSIDQVMAKNVVSVSPNATIKQVAKILGEREFHAVPVVDDYRLVGMVTTTDLINYLIKKL